MLIFKKSKKSKTKKKTTTTKKTKPQVFIHPKALVILYNQILDVRDTQGKESLFPVPLNTNLS